jgi:TolB-like protein
MKLLAELKRRNVIRMGGLYLVGAWLVTQVASTVFPAFDLPGWALRGVILLLAIGFVPALIFAWVFELTPDGLKRDDGVTGDKSFAPQTARRIDRMIIVVLLLALGYFAVDKFVVHRDQLPAVAAAPAPPQAQPPAAIDRRSIAVLPFENLSGDADNAYFVAGIQDLILTNLSKIRGLKVISRNSVAQYASHPEDLKTVGAELGVAHLLEGSVQRAGNDVLINLQLVEVATNAHLWAESYRRTLTQVFEVEQEVADIVAKTLNVELGRPQAMAVRARQSTNAVALDAFMRAEYAVSGPRAYRVAYREAVDWYEKSIAADPDFALAHAQLAIALTQLRYFGGRGEHTAAEYAARAEQALATARKLQPDLIEADIAAGFMLNRSARDYVGGLAMAERTLEVWPGEARLWLAKMANLRQLGRMDEALVAVDTALSLSPRDENLLYRRAETLAIMRRYAEAEAAIQHLQTIHPGKQRDYLAWLLLVRHGDVAQALAVNGPSVELLRLQGNVADALRMAQARQPPDAESAAYKKLQLGELHLLAGDRAGAEPLLRAAFAEFAALIGPMDDYGKRLAAASAQALLGDERTALDWVERALATVPPEQHAMHGARALGGAARVYAVLGRIDLMLPALARLRTLPAAGDAIWANQIRLDPTFRSVRDDPRVQAEIPLLAALER